ncbi:DUF1028 domain-containing protein [Peristeroidobacter soli]|uniref:DUF1028 domain-containing protein n=1 Tax=Peristeroidobacter soli TaxID=2497877 RepID=UPI00130073FF|nr:DUF1028 domain-containing protein [Peristeroidobacter soli]
MMKYLALAFVLFAGPTPARATWSVIALDARSGQVVIASATCVRQEAFPKREPSAARDLMDLQAVIVPGGTLLGDQVVYLAALAFTRATGTLADRVMAAMEAADANGGDHRCNCGSNPMDFVPCDNKTAHVSYIAIAEKDDPQGVTHNDGKYFAYISVMDNDIKRGESGNPVRTLRMRYDAWVKSGSPRLAPPPPTLYQPKT